MGKRREGREVALQLLFHWDLNVQQSLNGPELDLFWEFRPTVPAVRAFATIRRYSLGIRLWHTVEAKCF